MKAKIHNFVGSIGALIGTFVFIAYIPQIMANLAGDKGQPWQPLLLPFLVYFGLYTVSQIRLKETIFLLHLTWLALF